VLRLLVTANVVPSLPIPFTPMMEVIRSSETSVHTNVHGVTSQKTVFLNNYGALFDVEERIRLDFLDMLCISNIRWTVSSGRCHEMHVVTLSNLVSFYFQNV
jgi:hypothetical protein